MLKPLGNKLLVRPSTADRQSAGGIHFPDVWGAPVPVSGEVVRVGRGPASAHRIRQATIAHCLHLLEDVADRVPAVALRGELEDALATYAASDVSLAEVHEGAYVCFPREAGTAITYNGEPYIVLDEQDIQAVWAPESDEPVVGGNV